LNIVRSIAKACFRFARAVVEFAALPFRVLWLHWLLHRLQGSWGKRILAKSDVPIGQRRIVMLVISDVRRDPRVQREAKALAASGFPVTIVCPAWSRNPEELKADLGQGIELRVQSVGSGRYAHVYPYLFGWRLYRAAVAEKAWAYHAHDLDVAVIALAAAAAQEAACVVDHHEWYSENVTWRPWTGQFRPHPGYKRWLYAKAERLALAIASENITVCDSIGLEMRDRYEGPKPLLIVRNIPELQPETNAPAADLGSQLGLEAGRKVILYQGGVGPSRNLEPVIRSLAGVPDAVFVIRGPGAEQHAEAYLEIAAKAGVADRIKCLPAVPSTQVVAEARGACAGLWTLLTNVGLNFKYSLPNKVFEYLAAGLPILAADLPEVRKIIDRYRIGVCFDPDDPESIAQAIRAAIDPEFNRACRSNMQEAMLAFSSRDEWNKVADLYRRLGEVGGSGRP